MNMFGQDVLGSFVFETKTHGDRNQPKWAPVNTGVAQVCLGIFLGPESHGSMFSHLSLYPSV